MNGKDLKPEKANRLYGQRNWPGAKMWDDFIAYQNKSLGIELHTGIIYNAVPDRKHHLRLVCVNGKRIV